MTHPLEYENRRASSINVPNTDAIKAKLTKKPQKPLQDKTQAQNITSGTLSKKLQTKNKAIKIPKSLQKSPLRTNALKHDTPRRFTPRAPRAGENVDGDKENIHPETPSRIKKCENGKSLRKAYCDEVIRSITAEMSQIDSVFEAIQGNPSLKTHQQRLHRVIDDIKARLQLYMQEQIHSEEIDQEAVKIQELQDKLTQMQSKYVPKSEWTKVKRELEMSEETLEEHKRRLEAAVSLDASEIQLIELEDQNGMIETLQNQLLESEQYESKYTESQNEVQQLRAAVTDLISENEQLHNQQLN
ncbi:hypothetical protein K493DRAFT_335112 [Basidiobolus meristosporus CBS 931.73]|uniref:Uncharacterized protein n=1 Tax=Basidiobolus meristosporus CBS 931.73 TaxID=1314790 RepID=A0A1Y1YT56_9FUNG|nr:hypothetical protein K493DRAFT_335112 [Basidiobolus meristosporus CBS 931.73]|eukprot:ORY00994.1 hypothetical protein K493DRAFT_335112 [Basidiobolus meristosporus CBS 931.73]